MERRGNHGGEDKGSLGAGCHDGKEKGQSGKEVVAWWEGEVAWWEGEGFMMGRRGVMA